MELVSENFGFSQAGDELGLKVFDNTIDFDSLPYKLELFAIGNISNTYVCSDTKIIKLGSLTDLNNNDISTAKTIDIDCGTVYQVMYTRGEKQVLVVGSSAVKAVDISTYEVTVEFDHMVSIYPNPLNQKLLVEDGGSWTVDGASIGTGVVGNWSVDGTVVYLCNDQLCSYKDGTTRQQIAYPEIDGDDVKPCFLQAVDSKSLFVGFSYKEDDESMYKAFIVNLEKEEFEEVDVAIAFASIERQNHYYCASLKNWIGNETYEFVTSGLATDVSTLYSKDELNVLMPADDQYVVTFPMNEDGDDLSPVGLAIDISNKGVKVDDVTPSLESATGLPKLWVYTNEFQLLSWWVFDVGAVKDGSASLDGPTKAISAFEAEEDTKTSTGPTAAFGESTFRSKTSEVPAKAENKPAFGSVGFGSDKQPTDKPAFGSSGFGSNKPAFGSSSFGNPDKPAFGSTSFGSDKPAFGSTSFGAAKPAFGSSSFGSGFGSGSSKPAATASGSGFGNYASGGFGGSGFGGGKKEDVFGSKKDDVFGSNQSSESKTSLFGSSKQENVFGSTKQESVFGESKLNSPFASLSKQDSGTSQPKSTFGGFANNTPKSAEEPKSVFDDFSKGFGSTLPGESSASEKESVGNSLFDTGKSKLTFESLGKETKSESLFASFGKKPEAEGTDKKTTAFTGFESQSKELFSVSGQKKESPFSGFGEKELSPFASFGNKENKASPFAGFGKKDETKEPSSVEKKEESKLSPFANLGKKEESPFANLGKKEESPFASFGKKDESPFAGFGKKQEDKPSPFASFGKKEDPKKEEDKPSPFAGFGKKEESPSVGFGKKEESPFAGFGKKEESPFAGYTKKEGPKSSANIEVPEEPTQKGVSSNSFDPEENSSVEELNESVHEENESESASENEASETESNRLEQKQVEEALAAAEINDEYSSDSEIETGSDGIPPVEDPEYLYFAGFTKPIESSKDGITSKLNEILNQIHGEAEILQTNCGYLEDLINDNEQITDLDIEDVVLFSNEQLRLGMISEISGLFKENAKETTESLERIKQQNQLMQEARDQTIEMQKLRHLVDNSITALKLVKDKPQAHINSPLDYRNWVLQNSLRQRVREVEDRKDKLIKKLISLKAEVRSGSVTKDNLMSMMSQINKFITDKQQTIDKLSQQIGAEESKQLVVATTSPAVNSMSIAHRINLSKTHCASANKITVKSL